MGEISKAVGQWVLGNVGWTAIIILFLLSCIFKIAKKEIDPLGWVIGWFGKAFTQDVRKDVAELKKATALQFENVKKDRAAKVQELKNDYEKQIKELRDDLDGFESTTNKSIGEMQDGTNTNCHLLQQRLDAMEKSNDMQTIRQIKTHVLDFANSCMNGRKHTIRDFRNIIKENKEYEALISKYGMRNDVYTDDFEYIKEVYHKCKENRSFLMDNGEPFEEDDEE